MVYNNVLEAVGHTPMVRLQRMNPEGNAQILVKFEGLNVGGSIKILCSAIKQKEAFWTQWHIGIGCWLIMNYRSMLLVSGYCVERLILEQWLFCTQLTQLGTNRQLGLATFWYCLLKPF